MANNIHLIFVAFAILLLIPTAASSAKIANNFAVRQDGQMPVLYVNLGSTSSFGPFTGDNSKYLTGESKYYTGSTGEGIYKSHRYGKNFGLSINDLVPGTYHVILHFNEIWLPNCGIGNRVFDITVGDKTLKAFDTFLKAGCQKPTTEVFNNIQVTDSLVITLTGIVQNAFISGIQVFKSDDIPLSTPSPSKSVTPPITSLKINLGSTAAADNGFVGDDGDYLTGTSESYTGSTGNGIYKSHRAGEKFGLEVDMVSGVYDVTLHFSENWAPNCGIGQRMFTVTVGDKPPLVDYDVFAKVGCQTPTTETFTAVQVLGTLSVTLKASVQKAFISGIEIAPSSANSITGSAVNVNFGSTSDVGDFIGDDGTMYIVGTSKAFAGSGTGIYSTHRWGKEFGLEFSLDPGSYKVVLHFNENWMPNCDTGKRVFTVTVGDKPPLVDYDVFAKVGCETPTTEVFHSVEVTKKLKLSLVASTQNAFLSAIEIIPLTLTATVAPSFIPSPSSGPAPSPIDNNDKAAHAVPPVFDDPIVDLNKDGVQAVVMDGSQSHTHFFDTNLGMFAVLTNYKWTNKETGEIMCQGPNKAICTYTFSLGATMVQLCVTDTYNNENCASTTVTVVESVASGVYCYFYDFAGSTATAVPLKKGLEAAAGASPKPLFGAHVPDVDFPNLASFPDFSFKNGIWAQRCVFFFTATQLETYQFTVKHIGGVALYAGDELVISADASSSEALTTTQGAIEIPEGLQQMDLIYFKTGGAAQLELSYNASTVQFRYDKATILPMISSITPDASGLQGAFVKVVGLNINKNTNVLFGTQKGLNPIYDEPKQVQLNAPPVTADGDVKVVLSNQAGTSNSVVYSYSGGQPPTISFSQTAFQNFNPNGVANIAIGPDFKYYMATAQGKVIVADVDHENGYSITSTCESATLSDPSWINYKTGKPAPRWALGIAFSPKDTSVKAYVATSSLFWGPGEQDYLNGDFAWANGNIEIIEPGAGCMKRTGFLVTGLPVSNHDHAINSLVFDNNNDLHFQVGGFTNQGIIGHKLGGIDENPLSAATVVALTSKGAAFNGVVKYDNPVPELAKQLSGDVILFATGLRNAYGLVLHSNGKFYATDNGPNNSFGERSETCVTKLPDKGHGDKILQLKKGKYYGSPNRNRGECVFIDDNSQTPSGGKPPASLNYDPPLAKVQSSTNGIMEYTANTFRGQLRGDLFATKFAGSGRGKVWRIGLKPDGKKKFGPDQFFNFESGLSVVQGHRGEIIMPQVKKNRVVVLKPSYNIPTMPEILAVTPFRGAKGGGNVVLITGHNFGSNPTVLFGSSPCTQVTGVTATSFKCTTPPGSGLVDVSVTVDGAAALAPDGFWYMNV